LGVCGKRCLNIVRFKIVPSDDRRTFYGPGMTEGLSWQDWPTGVTNTSLRRILMPVTTTTEFKTLTTTDIVALTEKQVANLTSGQIHALITSQLAVLKAGQVNALSVRQLGILSPAQVAAFSTAVVVTLKLASLISLTSSQISGMTTRQVAALTSAQVAALDAKKQVPFLTTSQIAVLTTQDLVALKESSIAALTSIQIVSLNTGQFGALTTKQIAALDVKKQVPFLTTEQLASLSAKGVAALKDTELAVLTTTQLRAIKPQSIAALTVTQLPKLTTTQIAALATDQLASLTGGQLKSLTTKQLMALTTVQVHAFSTAQIKALSPTAHVTISAISSTGNAVVTTKPISALTTTDMASLTRITPIVLDLTGKGIRTVSMSTGVMFDLADTGQKLSTGWIGPGEGLLALDRNQDGVIDSGSELFGSATVLPDGRRAADGYDALRAMDTNNDGALTNADPAFASLAVWIDRNADGVSQSGGLKTLGELAITQLDLNPLTSTTAENGNLIGLVSSYHTSEGGTHEMADVWFSVQALPDAVSTSTVIWNDSITTSLLGAKVNSLAQAISAFRDDLDDGAVRTSLEPMAIEQPEIQALAIATESAVLGDVLRRFEISGILSVGPVVTSVGLQGVANGAGLNQPNSFDLATRGKIATGPNT